MRKILLLSIIAIGFASCHGGHSHPPSVLDQIAEGEKLYDGMDLPYSVAEENHKTHHITEGEFDFFVLERKHDIKSFPCSECHSVDLANLKNGEDKKAHWDISIEHASESVMNCQSCHSESSPNHLTSNTGALIDFNESYRLCAQCHSPQYKEWLGGAHGKRVDSWVPPRISYSCTNCHNPHDPSFGHRWPARYKAAE